VALKDGKMISIGFLSLGFYAKGFDGRIEIQRRLERRGLWSTNGDARRGSRKAARLNARAVHIQFRPIHWRTEVRETI